MKINSKKGSIKKLMDISKDELLKVLDEIRQEVYDKDLTGITYKCHKGSRVSNNYEVNKNGSNIFKINIKIN